MSIFETNRFVFSLAFKHWCLFLSSAWWLWSGSARCL